jgi:transposase
VPHPLLSKGVHIPPIASQAVLRLLRYRQRLVEVQTKLRNGLQALAFNHQAGGPQSER